MLSFSSFKWFAIFLLLRTANSSEARRPQFKIDNACTLDDFQSSNDLKEKDCYYVANEDGGWDVRKFSYQTEKVNTIKRNWEYYPSKEKFFSSSQCTPDVLDNLSDETEREQFTIKQWKRIVLRGVGKFEACCALYEKKSILESPNSFCE
jgi:hypothetical protein